MKCILLAEDDQDSREIYRSVLEHAGFTVVAVADGGEAVRVALEKAPDLILMDIGLPYVNGWEAAKILKNEPSTHSIPVIAVTALVSEADHRRAQAIGFEEYLEKPVAPRDVLARVKARIGSP